MAASTTKNPQDSLQQLFRKLTQNSSDEKPYVFLLQHSLSFALRQKQASVTEDEQVYRRAGLLTPSETAAVDWQAGSTWLRLIIESFLQVADTTVLWVSTTPCTHHDEWLQEQRGVTRLDLAIDPFGWDSEDDENDVANLENLEKTVETIQCMVQELKSNDDEPTRHVALVLESLSPLLTRHGFAKTLEFLSRILNTTPALVVIVPVQVEQWTVRQHAELEALAQAVLSAANGEAVLMRQGVRESGNLVRESFRLVEPTTLTDEIETDSKAATRSITSSSATTGTVRDTSSRPGRKVQLQMEEEARVETSQAPGPHIIVQDDDPEYEDYDEEDPDDDLDL